MSTTPALQADSMNTIATGKKQSVLPGLPYTLHARKRSIAIHWTLILLFTFILPEFLYFLLRYGASTSTSSALTIPTALLLVVSILAIGHRAFLLYRPGSQRRPLGAKWWAADYFHVNMILGFGLITGVLASATGEHPPSIRQAAMPQSILLYWAGSQLLVTGAMAARGWKTPVRLSSMPRGAITRPGVFILIEDIVAVDGGGGQQYRRALVARYESSVVFRSLLTQLNWFWGIGSLLVAVGVTVIVFVVDDLNVVYALGWALPWVWAMAAAACAVFWSQTMLKHEV